MNQVAAEAKSEGVLNQDLLEALNKQS